MADYGYSPYQEARLSTRQRLGAALQGLSAVPRGANWAEALLAGFGGGARSVSAAQQAAQEYAMKQQQAQEEKDFREIQKAEILARTEQLKKPPTPDKPSAYVPQTFDEWRKMKEEEHKLEAKYRAPKEGDSGKPKIGDYDKMSDNFRQEPAVRDYQTVRDNYRRIESSSKLGSGFGDLSMIFSFMKVLDPTSTVREGEFNNAAEAMGRLQKMYNVPKQWWAGTRLTPMGRAALLRASKSFHDTQKQTYDSVVKRYRKTATKYGVDPTDVITDYQDTPPANTSDPAGIR